MAVYLFYGQEEYLINKEIKSLKEKLLDQTFVSMGYKVFDNPSFNILLEILQSAPLMFGNTLNVISMEKYLIAGAKDSVTLDDKQIESFELALSQLCEQVNVIFLCKSQRNEYKKPDSRKKLYKVISKYSQVKEFPQYRNFDKTLHSVINDIAKEKGLKADTSCIEFIVEQLGVNLNLIDSELEKLKIAIYPDTKITKESVKTYCVSSEDIFILADLIIQGNKNAIMNQYKLLTERHHYLEILAFLQSSIQKFVFIKNYENKMSSKDIAAKLRPITEFIVDKIKKSLSGTSLDRLLQIKSNLVTAEYKLKSGQSAQEDTILELALLS